MMKYKGYSGVAEVDLAAGTIHGRVVGIRAVIDFQGESVAEVEQAFRDSVDFYLRVCARRGKAPETPYSGKFVVRVPSALHRAMAEAAQAQGASLSTVIERTLTETFLDGGRPTPSGRS